MNRKQSRSHKKLAILPIVVIALLVSTGAAYAFWTDALFISGTVYTANFDCELSLPDPYYWDCESKDIVTEADVTYEWESIHPEDPDKFDEITITVNGAYPGYHGIILMGVVSRGLIPAHMQGDPIITTSGPELNVWLSTDEEYCQGPYTDPFPWCWQLHTQEYFFHIHFEVIEDDDAQPPILPQQGATYTFTITFPLVQYNYDSDCPQYP
jgi:hypothetical protein